MGKVRILWHMDMSRMRSC
uniref:Uncharacterized protein n=1 Tax=Arundo donax TaxID=35708 RepID=A0A0A9BD91_ARUDO